MLGKEYGERVGGGGSTTKNITDNNAEARIKQIGMRAPSCYYYPRAKPEVYIIGTPYAPVYTCIIHIVHFWCHVRSVWRAQSKHEAPRRVL